MTLDDIAIDALDRDYLVKLQQHRILASRELDAESAAYYRGRIDEYTSQNAIPPGAVYDTYEEAVRLLYGDGPKEGLQS